MSEAYKCDCCGDLFEKDEHEAVTSARTVQVYTCNTKGRNFDEKLDLCRCCQDNLETFIGNSIKFRKSYSEIEEVQNVQYKTETELDREGEGGVRE